MARAKMTFPDDFLWGTATSAHQVEGDNQNNDWWQWEQDEGHILDGRPSLLAADWWNNAEADLDRAAEMGTNAHRMSLEWSRIEPEPSRFDTEALDRYRQILTAMHDRGIEPMVTLHHFTNPLWLVDKGDFNTPLVVDYFQRYAAKVVDVLGDLVPKWITINEPMAYVVRRYLTGRFPAPRRTGWSAAMQAVRILLRCHAAAYHTIKEKQPAALVGLAKNVPILEARAPGSRLDRWWANQASWLFNDALLESLTTGRLRWPVGRGQIPNLAGSFDFLGLNYYSRYYVHFPPGRKRLYDQAWNPSSTLSDGNESEIYSAGLYRAIKFGLRYGKPIYITGNGVADRQDRHRPAFLLTHLREVWRAINFNFPVMGYYHWSLIDNFEWDRGWRQQCGLIAIDPETQERQWRPSGRLYAEMCRSGTISSDMVATYAPEQLPKLFPGESPGTETEASL